MAFVTDDFDAYITSGLPIFEELTRALMAHPQNRLLRRAHPHRSRSCRPANRRPRSSRFCIAPVRRAPGAVTGRGRCRFARANPGKSTIGQVIRSRITDLVKKLLTDRANGDAATCALRLGHHYRRLGNLGNGVAPTSWRDQPPRASQCNSPVAEAPPIKWRQ